VGYEDLWKGKVVSGTAFEFLPEDGARRASIYEFIRRSANLEVGQATDVEVSHRFPAHVESDSGIWREAIVHLIDASGMSLEAQWTARVGEHLRVEMPFPEGKSVRFEGDVVEVESAADGFQIRMDFCADESSAESEASEGGSIERAMREF